MIAKDILIFFDKKQGRRPKVILGLLTGKMTVSSLYWGLSYQMLNYLNFWKQIDAQSFLNAIKQALQQGYLVEKGDLLFLTEQGSQQKIKMTIPNQSTNCLKIDEIIALSLLATQVLSEFSFRNNRYIPVTDDQRNHFLIKKWFRDLKKKYSNNSKIVQTYIGAMTKIADELGNDDADLLLNYLPSHVDSGMTVSQLAKNEKLTIFQMELKLRVIFSRMAIIVMDQKIAPLIDLFENSINADVLPTSAKESWKLLQAGYSIKQVSSQRKVKLSTVKEHILMAAILNRHFPFEYFIKHPLNFKNAPNKWDFSTAQEQEPAIEFFEFRLQQIKYIKELQNARNN